ncbi:class I SAM-dependent methyltransferase [Pinisolibacter sp.]|uniref:class I SAM-dependent methyltransferase n=1 Tax=Pinisolibacter sp. TaxID=2172024 RepID=UPI002FDCED8C
MTAGSDSSHWEGVHSTRGETEVSWFQASPEPSLRLIERAGIAPSASVIDVGGGASRLVDALLDRGFASVAVLDLSAAALGRSRARLGSRAAAVDWIVADATAWTPTIPYDLWHDRAAFHFLTEEPQRAAYVERLRAALRPGGHAIVATFALDGPERCSGLPVVRYDGESLARALGPGFERVETVADLHRTPSGGEQRFQFSLFRRLADV